MLLIFPILCQKTTIFLLSLFLSKTLYWLAMFCSNAFTIIMIAMAYSFLAMHIAPLHKFPNIIMPSLWHAACPRFGMRHAEPRHNCSQGPSSVHTVCTQMYPHCSVSLAVQALALTLALALVLALALA